MFAMADFETKFPGNDTNAKVQFGEIQTVSIGGELYEGEYAVTPKIDQQIMPTKGKLLTNDVTVHPIPFFKTSNTSGGKTVYIAKEI